jgi:hypothetical protein
LNAKLDAPAGEVCASKDVRITPEAKLRPTTDTDQVSACVTACHSLDVDPMRSKPHFAIKRVIGMVLLIACFFSLWSTFAQAQQAGSPAAKPPMNPDNPPARRIEKPPGAAIPAQPQINPQELERLTKAADKVLNRIQGAENDLYLRVSYFEKPERLNPNSFASKEEVAEWQVTLQQLKEKYDLVGQLYASVGKDLDTEFRSAGGSEEIVSRFRKFIMDGFPWTTIDKKKALIADFIDEQGKLLLFYEKNWGSWTSTSDANKPEFTSASAANIYKRLRDQILNTSEEIEKEYKEMSD